MTPTTEAPSDDLGTLRNRIFGEIAVGDTESVVRALTAQDIQLYAVLSGDENPQHLDERFAASTAATKRLAASGLPAPVSISKASWSSTAHRYRSSPP